MSDKIENKLDWVKRLGQWHFMGENKTLCGMPMLGNNYANVIRIEDREKCKACHKSNKGEVI